MAEKLLGKLISLKYTDRKEPIRGIVVDYNNHWTLMIHNPVDYVIDGYIILRHKNIQGYQIGPKEKFVGKILQLKKKNFPKKRKIPIDDLKSILTYLTKVYKVFKVETKSETACYLGKLKSIDDKTVVLDFLNSAGRWDGQVDFKVNEIRTIAFDSDYENSLKLISK